MQRIANALIRWRVSPNAISCSSMVFAAGAGAAFYGTTIVPDGARWLWLVAAVCVQLRLLANLFDGMVAVGSGAESPLGEIYNEVPDRVADAFILVGAGYAVGSSPELGFLATIVALLVAYVRAIGAKLGAGQLFHGPQAKPHRMFLVTVAALYSAVAPSGWQMFWRPESHAAYGAMALVLAIVIVGGLVTVVRRLSALVAGLRETA